MALLADWSKLVNYQLPTTELVDSGVTRTVTGTTSPSYDPAQDLTLQQSTAIFQNILSGSELPETFREATTTNNLLALGQSSIDISNALAEAQRINNANFLAQQTQTNSFLNELNARLGGELTPKTQASDLSKTGQSTIKDSLSGVLNSVGGVIGVTGMTAGIILGGIILFTVLKK